MIIKNDNYLVIKKNRKNKWKKKRNSSSLVHVKQIEDGHLSFGIKDILFRDLLSLSKVAGVFIFSEKQML